jgi:methionine synthase II (cobalamin-independent)
VPTASGFGRHRRIHPPEASAALEGVFEAITAAGAVPVAHCCGADAPIELVRGAGARGISLDADLLTTSAYDEVGALLEAGERLFLGVVPSSQETAMPGERAVTERVLRLLDMLGFDPEAVGAQLVLTPSCGLAGASPEHAKKALALVRTSASQLAQG